MISKEILSSISNLFKEYSVTKATIKNKDYMWQSYIDFCDKYDESPVPATGETLVKYSVYLIVQRECSIPTVRNHFVLLRGIKRCHMILMYLHPPSISRY